MSEATDRARAAGWEVGNADRLNQHTTPEPGAVQLEALAGVCSPYDHPDEHYGHMQQSVWDAHDALMDVLYDAYQEGYTAGRAGKEE